MDSEVEILSVNNSPFQELIETTIKGSSKAVLESDTISLELKELLQLSKAYSESLNALGLGEQEVCILLMEQGMEMAISLLSIPMSGICFPLNPESSEREIQLLIDQVRPKMLIYSGQFQKRIEGLSFPEFSKQFQLSLDPESKQLNLGQKQLKGIELKEDDLQQIDKDRIAYFLLTSGTTSKPKVVPLSHGQLMASAKNLIQSLKLGESDRSLNVLSMFHIGGILDLLIAPLLAGGKVYCGSKFNSKEFHRLLHHFKPSWIQAVPTMFADYLNYLELNDGLKSAGPKLRFLRSVSSAMPIDLAKKLESYFNAPIIEIYGMSETAGVICSNPLSFDERRLGSVGKPLEGISIQIINQQNNPVESGQTGRLIIKGENVFRGYWQAEAENREIFIGGYFKSGDLAYQDESGFVYLVGREKEMINRGGEKISPFEIDTIAEKCPGVIEAAAFALPHPTLGEEVALAIKPEESSTISETEIRSYLAERLGVFKQARKIYFVKELPRNASGKLQRHLLNEQIAILTQEKAKDSNRDRSDLEKQIEKVWARVLEIKGIGRDDDFFDLGGDSLRALLLVDEIEKELKVKINAKLIYEQPLFSDFVANIQSATPEIVSKKTKPKGIRSELVRLMEHWPGKRYSKEGLIVERNSVGNKMPIYWCTNSLDYFEMLVGYLSKDHPVLGFVTLFESKLRSAENNLKAAEIYAKEIIDHHPHDEIILGGWCEGGKIVTEMTRILESSHKKVSLLFLQDSFIPLELRTPVNFYYSDYGMERYRYQFDQANLGISKYYIGGSKTFHEPIKHDQFYLDKMAVQNFIGTFERSLENKANPWHSTNSIEKNDKQRFKEVDYSSTIMVKNASLILSNSGQERLYLKILNQSTTDWLPTKESGIKLMVRLLDYKYEAIQQRFYAIDKRISSGDSLLLDVDFHFPSDQMIQINLIEIDLIDDGIARFSAPKNKYIRFPESSKSLMVYPVLRGKISNYLKWMEKLSFSTTLSARSPSVVAANLTIIMIRKLKNKIDQIKYSL